MPVGSSAARARSRNAATACSRLAARARSSEARGREVPLGGEAQVVELDLVEPLAGRLARDRDRVGPRRLLEGVEPRQPLRVEPEGAGSGVGDRPRGAVAGQHVVLEHHDPGDQIDALRLQPADDLVEVAHAHPARGPGLAGEGDLAVVRHVSLVSLDVDHHRVQLGAVQQVEDPSPDRAVADAVIGEVQALDRPGPARRSPARGPPGPERVLRRAARARPRAGPGAGSRSPSPGSRAASPGLSHATRALTGDMATTRGDAGPSLRLTTLGVGAQNSPRYRPAGLLVVCGAVRVMIDGGLGAVPDGRLDAWLVTDERAELIAEIRRAAGAKGLRPHAGHVPQGRGARGAATRGAHQPPDLGIPHPHSTPHGRLGAGVPPVPVLGGGRRPHVRGGRGLGPSDPLRGRSRRPPGRHRRRARGPAAGSEAARVRPPRSADPARARPGSPAALRRAGDRWSDVSRRARAAGQITPCARPTFTNAATARSRCAGSCAALICTRIRAWSRGTTG